MHRGKWSYHQQGLKCLDSAMPHAKSEGIVMHWPTLIAEQDVTVLCVAQREATHVRADLGK